MKQTYEDAIAQVYRDEGGYSNVAGDTGGPTNYGITIGDARQYWKADATASDVRTMPRSVADDIYRKHYANAINYDSLPAGVDYAVLDYGILAGIGRSTKVYNQVKSPDAVKTINAIYDERTQFLTALGQQPSKAKFLRGWLNRTKNGRSFALNLNNKYTNADHKNVAAGGVIVTGGLAATQAPHHVWPWIIAGTVGIAALVWIYIHFTKKVTQ